MFMPIGLLLTVESAALAENPNIVFVLCDDLGYGDVQCLNPDNGKIPTPNVDRIASEGMTFTDAHSASSVCTPTRYGIMTGRYCWRTRLQKGVVQGFAPSLIAEDRVTVAGFLKSNGYHTGVIGKWHLDFRYQDPETGSDIPWSKGKAPPVDATIPDGPVHRGFDYFHGFHHARNMKAVIENDRVIEHDEEINMLPRLTRKSVEFIQSQKGRSNPFFLYVPLGSPHTPILPTPKWQGKSGLNAYADFVMETDDAFGQIVKAIEDNGFAENTLLIFSSDNGCSRAAKIKQLKDQGHHVSAHYRGSKADIWDGGHRIPFFVRWPGKVKPGSSSGELVCLNDLYATFADLINKDAPARSCEDSVSFLPQLSGEANPNKRTTVVHHSVSGHFAYRDDAWKLILARGSGGWSSPNEKQSAEMPKAQLYDLTKDPSEKSNLFLERPEIAESLLKRLTKDIESGRTTIGDSSKNDEANIKMWKSGKD